MVDGDHLTRPDGVLRAVAVLQDDQAVARVHLHLRLTSVVHVQDIRLLDRNVPVRQVVTLEHTGAFVDLQLDLWRLVCISFFPFDVSTHGWLQLVPSLCHHDNLPYWVIRVSSGT